MAVSILLSVGDGDVTDDFDLTQFVVEQGIAAPPPEPGARTRLIELTLDISGASADALWTAWGNIEKKLYQAWKARGVYGQGTGVTLSVKLDTTNYVYFDILDGSLALSNLGILLTQAYTVLSLVCLPFGRGDAETETATATLTNGAATWLVTGIPGDVPALARLTIEDVSTNGQVINGLHVYQRSHHDLTAGHFDPVVELTAALPGVATTDSSSYSGSNFARLSANTSWRTIAEATRPAGDFNNGLYDLWLRLRDSSAVPSAPRNHVASVTEGIGITVVGSRAEGGVSSTSVTLSDAIPADTHLILNIGHGSGTATITSITDIGGAIWALATDGADDARVTGSSTQVNQYWMRTVTAVPSGTVISVATSATSDIELIVLMVDGIVSPSPVEQVAADKTQSSSATITTNSVTTTQAYQLLVATVRRTTGTYGSVPDWTNRLIQRLSAYHRTVTSAGTYSLTSGTGSNSNHAGTLVSYKAANVTVGSIGTGTWNLFVAAVGTDGLVSAVSNIQQVTVANSTDVVNQTWDAPATGTVASYRVYRDRGTGWGYFGTGGTTTSYQWTTETGIVGEAPDIDGDSLGLFRVQVALANGEVVFTGDAFSGEFANDTWEDALSGTVPLPPIPALDGEDPPDWLFRVQGKGESTLDVDLVWLMPHDEPQLIAEYTGLDLATARDWVLDQRRDGRVSGRLYEANTTTDAGQVDTIGCLYVGPGATQLAVRCTVANGVSDVTDAKIVATLRYVPLYRRLGGA